MFIFLSKFAFNIKTYNTTMKIRIFSTFTFLFFSLIVFPHNNDKLIKLVTDSLLLAETGTLSDNCIRDKETGMALSCFEIHSQDDWVSDFDGDGQLDVLVHFLDEGLGSGGNVFGYNYKIAYIKNGKIDRIDEIFGGGKFSDNHLQIDQVKDGKIYATLMENQMVRMNHEDESPLKERSLIFQYKDGNIQEISYNKCPIAEMNKNIFKTTSSYHINRNVKTNSNYEQEQHERLIFNKKQDLKVYATFSGCENPELYFSVLHINLDKLSNTRHVNVDREYIVEVISEVIRFLAGETRYTSTLNNLLKEYEKADKLTFDSGYSNSYNVTYKLINNWDAQITAIDNKENKQVEIIIDLKKTDNPTSK